MKGRRVLGGGWWSWSNPIIRLQDLDSLALSSAPPTSKTGRNALIDDV